VSISLEAGFEYSSYVNSSEWKSGAPQMAAITVNLLGSKVEQVHSQGDGTLELTFSNGDRIVMRDTSKEYESYQISRRGETRREFQRRLSDVNSITAKPRPTATFREFAMNWVRDILSRHKRSTPSGDRSRLRKHLLPELGDKCMKVISGEVLQSLVARKSEVLSAKSVRNLIALLSEMWAQAKAHNYTQIDPFFALRLPDQGLLDEPI